ncbi:unnamed protein product, partial [Mesorhabditis spiculigera]
MLAVPIIVFLGVGCCLVDAVTVTTKLGDVQGFHVDYTNEQSKIYRGAGDIFLGIPYVQPPLGALRFAAPAALNKLPNSPWDATYFRSPCSQSLQPCGFNSTPSSEDCLYLNVFSPDVKTATPFPVMVWIHGGSFQSGCAQQYPYKGGVSSFVSRGVVVVTIQYRLGFWGFFTTGSNEFPANRGMLDQVAALRWVQDHIRDFGGDPTKVTIFGESAGAASVSALTYSPMAQSLFSQAIQESGATETCLNTDNKLSIDAASKLCGFTGNDWSGKDWQKMTNCVQNKSAVDILKSVDMAWNMVYDTQFLPDTLENLGKTRKNFPSLIGVMRDEWSYFVLGKLRTQELFLSNMTRGFIEYTFNFDHTYMGDKEGEVMQMLEKVYHPTTIADDDYVGWVKLASDMYSGQFFGGPMQRDHDYSSNVGRIFSLPGWTPVPHCSELFFMWLPDGEWARAEQANEVIQFDYDVANFYADSWTNFAKNGKPMGNQWEAVEPMLNRYWRISPDGMRMADGWRQVDSTMWNKVIPSILSQQSNVATTARSPATTTQGSAALSYTCIIVLLLVLLLY